MGPVRNIPFVDPAEGELPSKALRFLIYSHIWLAIGMAAQVLWMGELFNFSALRPAVAIGAGLIAAYGTMRILRSLEPHPIPSPHINWVMQNRSIMTVLTICAAIISLIAVYPLHFVFGRWTLVAAALVALYITPLRNKMGSSIGIRNVPVLKAPLIAGVCALVTIGLSADVVFDVEREMLKWIAIPQFAFFLAITTTYDIADVHYDDHGLKTFPQLFGVTGTKLLAILLMVPWFAFYIISMYLGHALLDPVGNGPGLDFMYLLPLAGLVMTAFIITGAKPGTNEWYYKIWLDGTLILIPLLGWLGSLL